jgi:hypothetical protein
VPGPHTRAAAFVWRQFTYSALTVN